MKVYVCYYDEGYSAVGLVWAFKDEDKAKAWVARQRDSVYGRPTYEEMEIEE